MHNTDRLARLLHITFLAAGLDNLLQKVYNTLTVAPEVWRQSFYPEDFVIMQANEVALLGILAVAVATDVRTGKIRNWLTFPALASGPIINFLIGGKSQAALSFAGMGAMILVAALLLTFRLVGGGDAKLLVAVGSLAGWTLVVPALLFTAVAGGMMAIIALLAQRKVFALFGQFARMIWLRMGLRVGSSWQSVTRTKLPYSVAIAAGTILAMFWQPAMLWRS